TWVSAIARDFFPMDEWFRVLNVDDVSDELRAEMLQALFMHFCSKQLHLKSEMLPAIRQLVIYGTSPIKIVWKDVEQSIKGIVRAQDQNGAKSLKVQEKLAKLFYG